MRVRPFNSKRFLVDIAEGDIFTESGHILVIGRPKGVQLPQYCLNGSAFWEAADNLRFPGREAWRYLRDDLPWRAVYAFPYNPKGHKRLPDGPNDLTALHYYLLRNELEFFLLRLLHQSKVEGDVTLGLIPLSWRKPDVIAHVMAEALANLFYCTLHSSEPRNLTVLIRSLDAPKELLRVFDRRYFVEWRRRLGWFPEAQDVWFTA